VPAGIAKLPADDSACTGIAAPSVETAMPHASSDIGFTMNTPLRADIGPLASFISYASARKGAVNIGKELFPGSRPDAPRDGEARVEAAATQKCLQMTRHAMRSLSINERRALADRFLTG